MDGERKRERKQPTGQQKVTGAMLVARVVTSRAQQVSVDFEMDFDSRYRMQTGNPSTGFYYEAFETINVEQVNRNGKYDEIRQGAKRRELCVKRETFEFRYRVFRPSSDETASIVS